MFLFDLEEPNQLFYLDSDDSGICDCENSLFIYSAETGECYQQNSQVFNFYHLKECVNN